MKAGMKTAASAMAVLMALGTLSFAVSAEKSGTDVHLSRRSIILDEGESAPIRLAGGNGKGTVKWKISNPDVFTYSNGKITAKKVGEGCLYAEYNGKQYKCPVTVNKDLQGMEADTKELLLKKGEKKMINISTGGKSVSVRVVNSNVCSVSCGVIVDNEFPLYVTALADGSATLKLFDVKDPDKSFDISVTVGKKSSGGKTVKENTLTVSEYPDEIIRRVNEERESVGLAPLAKSDSLCKSAGIRAEEIAVKFSHERPDNTQCFTVIEDSSYSGENIGMGYTLPEEAIKGWMTSPGHMANILDPAFTKIGVAYNEELGTWVQMFSN